MRQDDGNARNDILEVTMWVTNGNKLGIALEPVS